MSLTYDDIAKIFEEIELSLISSLRRNLAGHKAWEKEEGFDWSAWQAEKLKNIERFRRENQAIMNLYKNVIDSDTLLLMEEQFKEGEELAKQQLAEQLHTDENEQEEVPIPDEHFFGVNNEKMDKLMSDITTIEQKAETAALRMTDDVYRQTLYKVQLAMGTGSMTLQQAIDSAVKDFLDKGINCIVYKDGRRVNISDYVRMALRTTSTRAKLQGQAKQLSELGYDTVIISTYGKCSDTCLPWQGRVYIDDVFTPWQGEQNGDMGKSNYCGKWFPLLSTAVKGGLFHPNCRHTMLQYIDGITKPPEVLDEEKIKDLYRKEQKLRALERNVRKAKRKVNGCSDAENIKKAKEELKKAQKAVKDFIEQTNQAENKTIFKRDYGREKVYSGETNGNISSLGVANSSESGIIISSDTSVSQSVLKHSNEGEFTAYKNPKNPEKGGGNFKNGGHGQANIEELDRRGIEYHIVKEYDNGVRVGYVPKHKDSEKRSGIGQSWFPKYWTEEDIKQAGEYVLSQRQVVFENKNDKGEIDSYTIFGEYKGVTVGIYTDKNGKLNDKNGTIFPDNLQRKIGDFNV